MSGAGYPLLFVRFETINNASVPLPLAKQDIKLHLFASIAWPSLFDYVCFRLMLPPSAALYSSLTR